MITISKHIETFKKDINEDDSIILALFEKITSIFFKAALLLGIPLLTYMLFIW